MSSPHLERDEYGYLTYDGKLTTSGSFASMTFTNNLNYNSVQIVHSHMSLNILPHTTEDPKEKELMVAKTQYDSWFVNIHRNGIMERHSLNYLTMPKIHFQPIQGQNIAIIPYHLDITPKSSLDDLVSEIRHAQEQSKLYPRIINDSLEVSPSLCMNIHIIESLDTYKTGVDFPRSEQKGSMSEASMLSSQT